MKRFSVPGVAIGILLDGDEHYCSKGVTAVDFPLDVDKDTLFQIGSTTKTFTATVLMMLVEEGVIDLEAPVRTYLPKFRVPDELTAKSVTVRHLFTHTAGWVGDYFDDLGRGSDALRRIVQRMGKKTPQLTPMNTVWAYNNAGFYVLGRLLEEVTGKVYEDLVKARIFDPLGMDHSFWFPEDVITYKTAIGHQALPDGSVRAARPWGLTRAANPAGGIVSSAVDQIRYARFHLEGGRTADGKRLLKAATVKRMQKPHAPGGSMCDHVGVSWMLEKVDGVQTVKHGGTVNGHTSEFLMVPSRGSPSPCSRTAREAMRSERPCSSGHSASSSTCTDRNRRPESSRRARPTSTQGVTATGSGPMSSRRRTVGCCSRRSRTRSSSNSIPISPACSHLRCRCRSLSRTAAS